MKHWLIIYDISDEKRLRKIAKIMESYGIRVQRSVFEMEADDATVEVLRSKVNEVLEDDDFVVYFSLCERDWQGREKYGVGSRRGEDSASYRIL
jgi:CRISPR-associated protein Cas2